MRWALALALLAACGSKDAPPRPPATTAAAMAAGSTRCILHRLADDNKMFDIGSGNPVIERTDLVESLRQSALTPPIGAPDDWLENLGGGGPALPPALDAATASAKVAATDTDPITLGSTLAALDRVDDLRARIAKASPDVALELAAGWLAQAMASHHGTADAVAAVIAARSADSSADDDLTLLVGFADPVGASADLAPLRRALETSTSLHRSQRLRLYHAALVGHGDDGELSALEQAIAADGGDGAAQAAVLRAADRGSLDDGLAAATSYAGHDAEARVPLYLAWLWARHVATGLEPGFEQRLAAAACKPLDGCLTDVVRGAAVRLGAGGLPATDLHPRCVDPTARFKRIAVLVAPDASGDTVLAGVQSLLDAGWDQVTPLLFSGDQATSMSCAFHRVAPLPADPEERVVLSVLVQPDRTFLDQSRIGEQESVSDPAVMKSAIDEIGHSAFFVDRKDAELAVERGTPVAALAAVLPPLCARFPDLEIRTRDQLTAKPQL